MSTMTERGREAMDIQANEDEMLRNDVRRKIVQLIISSAKIIDVLNTIDSTHYYDDEILQYSKDIAGYCKLLDKL